MYATSGYAVRATHIRVVFRLDIRTVVNISVDEARMAAHGKRYRQTCSFCHLARTLLTRSFLQCPVLYLAIVDPNEKDPTTTSVSAVRRAKPTNVFEILIMNNRVPAVEVKNDRLSRCTSHYLKFELDGDLFFALCLRSSEPAGRYTHHHAPAGEKREISLTAPMLGCAGVSCL